MRCRQHAPRTAEPLPAALSSAPAVAAGDVKPPYESLQLGLLCCLPRLISFNYLSPFPPLSLSRILRFFQVMIFLLSPKPRLPLPVCLQLPSLLPAPSLSPLLFSTSSSLHAALLPAPPALCRLPLALFLHFPHPTAVAVLRPLPALLLAVFAAGAGAAGVPARPGDAGFFPVTGCFAPPALSQEMP